MSVRFDTGTDTLRGAGPSIGTGQWSHGFCIRFAATGTSGQVFSLTNDFTTPTGAFLSLEATGTGLKLFTAVGSSDEWAYSAGVDYYIVIGRDESNTLHFRVFNLANTSTPVFSSVNADGSGTNYTLTNRGYGAASGFNGNAIDFQMEAEKWELGVYWTNAECWAEAQKYALQRSGGTAEIEVHLTTSTDLTDNAGTAQSLTNSGCANGANHPDFLETLGGGMDLAGTARATPPRSLGALSFPAPWLTLQFVGA